MNLTSLQVSIMKGSGRTESSGVDPVNNFNGDWSYDESLGMLTYLISYKERPLQNRKKRATEPTFKDFDVTVAFEK